MQAALMKFLEKYGPRALDMGKAAGGKAMELGGEVGKAIKGGAGGAVDASALGAGALGGAGLGAMFAGGGREDEDEELKKLLMAMGMGG